jgi:hypothetical protein
MRNAIVLAGCCAVGWTGCYGSSGSQSDDERDADVLPGDAADGDDAGPAEDSVLPPDDASGDETLTTEVTANIGVWIGPGEVANISVTFCRYDPPLDWATRLATSGPCDVRRILSYEDPPPGGVALDPGDLAIEVDGRPVTLREPDPSFPCYRHATDPMPPIPVGATIRARSPGGADVGPFDLSVVVLEKPELTEPVELATMTAGLPWRFAWTPPDASDVQLDFSATLPSTDPGVFPSFGIFCHVLAASPVNVPAELTGLWPADLTAGHVLIFSEALAVSTTDPPVTLRAHNMGPYVSVDVAHP